MGFELQITSKIPIGAGIGSSGSYCVAMVAAMLSIRGRLRASEFDQSIVTDAFKDQVNALSFECEKLIHGTPSGIDNAVSVYGKPCFLWL